MVAVCLHIEGSMRSSYVLQIALPWLVSVSVGLDVCKCRAWPLPFKGRAQKLQTHHLGIHCLPTSGIDEPMMILTFANLCRLASQKNIWSLCKGGGEGNWAQYPIV